MAVLQLFPARVPIGYTSDGRPVLASQELLKSFLGLMDRIGGTSAPGLVSGPASATNNAIVLFDGTTGKLVKDSLTTIDADGMLAANSDTRIATQKATRTYADAYSRRFLLMGA